MNKYAQEVLNRSGANILALIQGDYPKGFFIVGSDTDKVIIGNGLMNTSYSRKTGKILETCIFSDNAKLSRKV